MMPKRKRQQEPRRIHRLMDQVYREMFRLEGGYAGAEMGLALPYCALGLPRISAEEVALNGTG
jgi:hypothetical protein